MLLFVKTTAIHFDIELLIFTGKKKTKVKPEAVLTNVVISESSYYTLLRQIDRSVVSSTKQE